jgi:hypothetical protein
MTKSRITRVYGAFAALSLAFLAACVSAPVKQSTFVFIKIIDSVEPVERARKYEDPISAALKATALGEVTGGGSLLGRDRKIEWVGVDVELTNVEKGLPFLRQKLVELGAPKGSVIEYSMGGKQIQLQVH